MKPKRSSLVNFEMNFILFECLTTTNGGYFKDSKLLGPVTDNLTGPLGERYYKLEQPRR